MAVVIGLLLALATGAVRGTIPSVGREGPPPILDPKSYTSPNGKFVLEVDPSARDGSGPARYHLLREGVEKWAGERPVTFWDAVVTDSGIAAGYAYTKGWHDHNGAGEFVVCSLDTAGNVVWRQASQRKRPKGPEGPANPHASGIFADPAHDRLVVRIGREDWNSRESWWIFSLSSGGEPSKLEPESPGSGPRALTTIVAAQPVPATPWTLVESWVTTRGAHFALLDADLKIAWRHDLPSDYDTSDEEGRRLLESWVRRGRAISTGPEPGRFAVQSVAGQEIARFEAASDPQSENGCRVREVAREPHPISFESPPDPEIPEVHLKKLGTVALQGGTKAPSSPIHDVYAFDFDAAGRIEVIRGSPDDKRSFSWVRVDPTGALDREARLPPLPFDDERRVHWSKLAGGRWLALASAYGIGAGSRAWKVDPESGEVLEIPKFDCPSASEIATSRDGGFVVLASIRTEYQMRAALVSFDGEGRAKWRIEQKEYVDKDPGSLFSPSDVGILDDGTVAVADSIAKSLQLFDGSGGFIRAIDLGAVWNAKAEYPCRVLASRTGGIYILDGGGRPRLYRMTRTLDSGAALELRYPDGRQPPPNAHAAKLAPDGALWTTDGQELECLGADGIFVRAIGTIPDANAPTHIDDAFVDPSGRVLAFDRRAKVIQVFDSTGRLTGSCKLASEDSVPSYGDVPLAVSGSGAIYVRAGPKGSYVQFDASWNRVGIADFGYKDRSLRCAFGPVSERPWMLFGYDPLIRSPKVSAELPLSQGSILRRPDGRWLRIVHEMTVARDGTFALLDGSSWTDDEIVPFAICTYAPDGNPQATIACPRGDVGRALAALDDWFALSRQNDVLLIERSGPRRYRFAVGSKDDRSADCTAFASPDGHELWVVDHKSRSLTRYAAP